MKKETLKELGKGFINFANAIGALSMINGFFGKNFNLSLFSISLIVVYIVLFLYIAGAILINKGAIDDWNLHCISYFSNIRISFCFSSKTGEINDSSNWWFYDRPLFVG